MTTILMSTRKLTTRPMTETTPTTPAEVTTSHSHSTKAATSTLYVDFSSTPYLLFSTTHVPISTPRRSLPTTPESTTSSRSRTTRLVSTQAVSTGQVSTGQMSTGQISTGQISVEVTTSPTGEMPVEVIISSTGEVSVEVTTTSTHFTTSWTTPLPPMYSMPMMTNYLRFSTQESGQRRMIRDRRPAFTTRGKPRSKQYRI